MTGCRNPESECITTHKDLFFLTDLILPSQLWDLPHDFFQSIAYEQTRGMSQKCLGFKSDCKIDALFLVHTYYLEMSWIRTASSGLILLWMRPTDIQQSEQKPEWIRDISNTNRLQILPGRSHWDVRVITALTVDWFSDSQKTLNTTEIGTKMCRHQIKPLIDKGCINSLVKR